MGRPIRISDEMMHLAEADSVLSKRTPPKQIEFWAEIGRRIEQQLTRSDLTVLLQGFATVSLAPRRPCAMKRVPHTPVTSTA